MYLGVRVNGFSLCKSWGAGQKNRVGEMDVTIMNLVSDLSCECIQLVCVYAHLNLRGGEWRAERVKREWQIESMGRLNGRMHKWDIVCVKIAAKHSKEGQLKDSECVSVFKRWLQYCLASY